MLRFSLPVLALLAVGATASAQTECAQCKVWNEDQAPFQIYGNTYYVGTHGLSSVLVTSPQGHILIDGALPESAPLIQSTSRSWGSG